MKKILIGVDISKETIDVSYINLRLSTTPEYLASFPNTPKGFKSMIKGLRLIDKRGPDSQWLFCCETTGSYDRKFCYWLSEHGFYVWRESALQIKWSLGVRRGKDDKLDCMAICDYLFRHQDRAVRFVRPQKEIDSLRQLFSYRQSLVNESRALRCRRSALLSQGKAASDAASFILQRTKAQMDGLKNTIRQCEEKMLKIINSVPQLQSNFRHITSINGVGPITAYMMIACTDNFTNITTANKMATYCGVAAFRIKSGTSINTRHDVSNLSNRTAKSILSMAARSATRYNPKIKEYYQRLMNSGKVYGIAINNVKNKLIHIIYALIERGCDYNRNYDHDITAVCPI